jgi:hypothetical protein
VLDLNSRDVPFTTREAQAAGLTRLQLTSLVRERQARRVLTGVYDWCEAPDTIERRARAAALIIAPWDVICDRTAAWLHGIDAFEFRELDLLPPLEVFARNGRHRIQRNGLAGGQRDLSPRDLMVIGPVLVTTPLRTAMDLGAKLPRRAALAVLDAFMRAHGLTRDEMLAELPRYRRRRGVVQLRELVRIADPRAESPGESWTRMSIIDNGLPVPELQVCVMSGGRELFRLDLAYERLRICIEYDGEEFHSSPAQIAHDRARRDWLREHGWHVIVLTKASFSGDARQDWLNELRRAIYA